MPIYRATHDDASALVAKKEKQGEVVTALSSDEGGVYIATTKPARRTSGAKETRG